MKWRDLALTVAVLLILAPYLSAQTQPVGGMGSVSGGVGRFADGTKTAPSIAFANNTNSGLYNVGGDPTVTNAGTVQVRFQAGQFSMLSSEILGWSSGDPTVAGVDTAFTRRGVASLSMFNGSTGAASLQTTGSAAVLALPTGSIGLATSATSTVGNTGQGARIVVVCGPTTGTASLLFYAGTTNVPVVLANAVGGGLIGC